MIQPQQLVPPENPVDVSVRFNEALGHHGAILMSQLSRNTRVTMVRWQACLKARIQPASVDCWIDGLCIYGAEMELPLSYYMPDGDTTNEMVIMLKPAPEREAAMPRYTEPSKVVVKQPDEPQMAHEPASKLPKFEKPDPEEGKLAPTPEAATTWKCSMCTYVNPIDALECQMCACPSDAAAAEPESEAIAEKLQAAEIEPAKTDASSSSSPWNCGVCTFQNDDASTLTCSMCGSEKS